MAFDDGGDDRVRHKFPVTHTEPRRGRSSLNVPEHEHRSLSVPGGVSLFC